MRLAARAVAEAASQMLTGQSPRVVILAGPGGNGGDGLYAGARLAAAGIPVVACLVTGSAHRPALEAFRAAGGQVEEDPQGEFDLAIDAIAGLGAGRAVDEHSARLARRAGKVLAVDVPSGIDAGTGVAAESFIAADATVTFGGLRPAHALCPHCGQILLADARTTGNPTSFREQLESSTPAGWCALLDVGQGAGWTLREFHDADGWGSLRPAATRGRIPSLAPGAGDDKYSGGVVALAAGSATYPGAGLLSAAGAVRATASMVRYAGPLGMEIVRSFPEVVIARDVKATGQAQAWVVGPGRGTDSQEILDVLALGVPTLLDADALTALAGSAALREAVRAHGKVSISPHAGEFRRVYEATLGELDFGRGRAVVVRELAAALRCTVLLKGRITLICTPEGELRTLDAGSSWAATPGSGDVLSGIAGAWLARTQPADALFYAATVHAHAAALAARTEFGPAPTSASGIAAAIPLANARLSAPSGA